jgi:hypothetical protein
LAAVLVSLVGGFLDRRHARNLARTDRIQSRLERTYLELAGFVRRRRMQANAIRPFMTFTGESKPVLMTDEEIERVYALVVSIASEKVRAIMDEFFGVVDRIISADIAITGMEATQRVTDQPVNAADWGGSDVDYLKRIHADQGELGEIEKRLHEQIRSELSK